MYVYIYIYNTAYITTSTTTNTSTITTTTASITTPFSGTDAGYGPAGQNMRAGPEILCPNWESVIRLIIINPNLTKLRPYLSAPILNTLPARPGLQAGPGT